MSPAGARLALAIVRPLGEGEGGGASTVVDLFGQWEEEVASLSLSLA